MGIHDRQYVRVGPHSRSGLGNVRFISINSWLIIINVAVFFLGATLLRIPTEVIVGQVWRDDSTQAQRAAAVPERSGGPLVVTTAQSRTFAYPLLAQAVDQTGRPLSDPAGRPLMTVVGQQLFLPMPLLDGLGHFSTLRGFFNFEFWRFITFQFLHANFTHLLFNMFGLWVFGGLVEQYLGSKRYLAFYLTCGIFGAVAYLLLNLLGNVFQLNLPGVLINDTWTPLVGASAGVFGVILASAYIAPNAMIMLIIPPVPLKLKWFAYGYVAIAAANLLIFRGANMGGDAAHLGGALAGAFFIRNAHLLRDFFDIFGRSKSDRGGRGPEPGPSSIQQAEVDRILGKVSREGLQSLTEGERRTLRLASERRHG
jgi:membrane associated rhomboid family serine protease